MKGKMMARFKYFSDMNGETVELTGGLVQMNNADFAERFPGVKGRNADGYSKWVSMGPRGWLPVTRTIEYKSNPSLHECNAKCLNGKCNGVCECQCGGKNHGRGTATVIDLAAKKHARLVLEIWDKRERQQTREQAEKRADVERKARNSF
jgi:hypothetical protein